MKKIEFRRHSIKQGPGDTDLSEAGLQLAKKVGEEFLRGKQFDAVFVSTVKRTHDTALAFMLGAGDFKQQSLQIFEPGVEVGSSEAALNLWGGVCNQAERAGEDMLQAALTKDPVMAREIAMQAARSFRVWLANLPQDTRVLVIGHSPFMELMAYGLFGTQLSQLRYCEGFEIIEDRDELTIRLMEKV